MFHIEIRQRPNVARAFNLGEEELRERFLTPLAAGAPFEYAGHEWLGRKTKVTILEGRELTESELLLGRGWSNAGKYGTDVTERVVGSAAERARRRQVTERLGERIVGAIAAGPLELDTALGLTGDLLAGRPDAERLQATAEAVWELLHRHQAVLLADGTPVEPGRWQQLLLAWGTGAAADLGGTGGQATRSSISVARSDAVANR